ncbi:MAG: glycosyltransferase family 39 protein, partial [Thermodesulfobacteriota bacterium]
MRLMESPSPVWVRADALVLPSLLALASLIRLPHLMAPYVINMDAINYIEAAKALLRGKLHEGLGMGHASIYPILVALSYKVLGDWVTAARLFPVAFGILTVVPLYLLVRQLMDHRLAWFPVMCYALSPAILTSSLDVIRDPLVWFGFSFFVWMLLKASHWNKWRQYLCCGVIALGCMSVRADSFLLVLAALIVAIYLGLRCGEVWRGLRNATAALLPLALASLSVMVLAPGTWKEVAALELRPYGRQIHASLGQVPPSAVHEVTRLIEESPGPRVA